MRWSSILFIIAGCIVLFRFWLTEPKTKNDGAAMIVGMIMFIALLVAAFGALVRVAGARDLDGRYAASPLKGWFDSLKSGKGPCCSDADGSVVQDADWESRDGRYRVKIEGAWYDVPDDAVLTQPNLYGKTMVWPIFYRSMGKLDRVEIRCFIPGPMT